MKENLIESKVSKKMNLGILYTLPLTVWLGIFFIIPMGIVFIYSFLKSGVYGGVELEFSLESLKILKDPSFFRIVLKTLYFSTVITVITIIISIPTAYFIARSKYKKELLFLIIIPFWTNFLVRIYAWIAILGNNGFLNSLLSKFGFEPVQFLYNDGAIIIISIYTSLPFAILPLYAVIEKFDFSIIEAGRDLGATNRETFFKLFLPNIKTGIVTAFLFTFIPMLGSYAIPKLVGGNSSLMLGNVIAQHLTVTRNWPLASFISSTLMLITGILIWLFLRFYKSEKEVINE